MGKGRKFRAYQRHSRSRFWHSVVNHHGFDVEIVLRDVSESEAYLKEIELIALYGRRDKGLGSLVNLTDGGEGGCGFVLTEDQRIAMSKRMSGNNNPNSDKTIWNFYNVKTKEIFVGTKFEMTKNHPEVSIGLLFSKGTTKRWIVQGFSSDDAMRRALSDKRIVNSEPKNTNIYTWLNLETGEISKSLGRGKHTTRVVSLFNVQNGMVLDTPGFSSLEFEDSSRKEIENTFKEFKNYQCEYTSCTHTKEQECSIRKAVDNNEILKSRYEDYLKFIEKRR